MAIESGCMIGDPAYRVFAEAYLKRHPRLRRREGLCPLPPDRRRAEDQSQRPGRLHEARLRPRQHLRTLENAYADYCAGRFAEALGKNDDAATFYRASLNYRNIYDPSVGNMRAKDANGTGSAWQGATVEGQGCVESNPYQQTGSRPKTCKA